MSTILETIAADKRLEVQSLKKTHPLSLLEDEMPQMESHRFQDALSDPSEVHIIAELKKASPSRGVLLEDFDTKRLAARYASGGAAALSVLTESKYFQGAYENLRIASEAAHLPVLCKDFILEPYQVYHARFCGADAILLIVALLDKHLIVECMDIANELGLDSVIEIHDGDELQTAIEVGANIIGVNNRNLSDFSVNLETSERLAPQIPDGTIRVSESGIFTREHITRLSGLGYNSFLIGEALVKAEDPEALIKQLGAK